MAAEATDDDYLLLDTHEVALGNANEKDFNTLVLSGIDLVVPVELDADGDPLQDDVVRLRSDHARYEQTLSSSDDDVEVDDDTGHLLYTFRHVPPGIYAVAVRTGSTWTPLMQGLVVTKEGAFHGSKKLGEELPSKPAARAPTLDDTPEEVKPLDGCER